MSFFPVGNLVLLLLRLIFSHYWGTNHTAIGNSVDWWERFVEKLDLLLETRMLKIQMKLDDLQLVEEGKSV